MLDGPIEQTNHDIVNHVNTHLQVKQVLDNDHSSTYRYTKCQSPKAFSSHLVYHKTEVAAEDKNYIHEMPRQRTQLHNSIEPNSKSTIGEHKSLGITNHIHHLCHVYNIISIYIYI